MFLKLLSKIRYILPIAIMAVTFHANAKTPEVKEHITQSGIKIWAIEDNYLPIVSVKIAFTKSGSAYDPENKIGLASMVSGLMVEGAGGMTGVEYMKRIEELASNINFSADSDSFYVSLTCLRENLDESLKLLALALKSPNFSKDAIERVRAATIAYIAKREGNPESRARKSFRENFFAGHPYSRPTEGNLPTVKAINRNDLTSYVKQHFARENMLIGVTGSISPEEMGALFDKYFSALPEKAGNIKDIAEFVPENEGRVIKLEQDVPQTIVIFGLPGPKRLDKDFYPMYLLNYTLGGGGFESRLMEEVRKKRGLAYNVYTQLQTYQKAGLISGYVATKNEGIEESLKVIRTEIEKMQQTGITEKEITDTKNYMIGSFPLKMTQNAALAAFITSMQEDNLGLDFLEKRNSYIKGVTLTDANEVAKKYLDTSKMLVIVVGKSK